MQIITASQFVMAGDSLPRSEGSVRMLCIAEFYNETRCECYLVFTWISE